MKKSLKKLSKSLKKKASKVAAKLKGIKLPKLSGQGKIGLAGIVVIAAVVAGLKGYTTLKAKAFQDGCVDGAAIGFTALLGPIVGDQFIVDKEKLFSKECGKLSGAYVVGKRVGDGREEEQKAQPQGGQEEDGE